MKVTLSAFESDQNGGLVSADDVIVRNLNAKTVVTWTDRDCVCMTVTRQHGDLVSAMQPMNRREAEDLAIAILAGSGKVVVDGNEVIAKFREYSQAEYQFDADGPYDPTFQTLNRLWGELLDLLGLDRPEDEEAEALIVAAMLEEGS